MHSDVQKCTMKSGNIGGKFSAKIDQGNIYKTDLRHD